jgi:transcription elongation GreA/GreB family factor
VIPSNRNDGRTGLGSIITIRDANDNEREITLVSHVEAKPPTHISIESPMGEALFNRASGELAKFQAPRGEIALQILNIKN